MPISLMIESRACANAPNATQKCGSDGTKIALIFIAITAFIASGFEHVIANMTTYTIGILSGDPNGTLALYGYNVLWVGLVNLVGGAVVVALAYWVVGGRPQVSTRATLPTEARIY